MDTTSTRRSLPAFPAPGEALPLVRASYSLLSRSERKVADYLLEHPSEVIYLSITEFADRVEVGEATISRFCQRVGFRGFQDLKLVLAQELVPGSALADPIPGEGAVQDLTRAVAYRGIRVIEETARLLDPDQIERAVDLLATARKIDFYGVGASGLTALDAQHRFMRIGKVCNAFVDNHVQTISASLLGPGDVAMAFSHSGGTRDVVAALRQARSCGAGTICVTSRARSPITRFADVVLLAGAGESTLISTLHSKIAHLFVLELLVDACIQRMDDTARDAIRRSTAAVTDRMY